MSTDARIEHNGLSSPGDAGVSPTVGADVPNATAGSMLGLLALAPMSGWELVANFEATIGHFWSVTRSQVYRELRVLEADGLVTLGEAGARERRLATITPAGRAAFARFIARPPGEETIRFPLLLTTFFADAVPVEVLRAAFAAQREVHAARLAGYERQMAAGIERSAPGRALAFGIAYERAVLAWIATLPWAEDGAPEAPPAAEVKEAEART